MTDRDFDNLDVQPVDMESLRKLVQRTFPETFIDGKVPCFNYDYAILSVSEDRRVLVNQEMIGSDEYRGLELDVYWKKEGSFSMVPILRVGLSREDLQLLPPIKLQEFMGSRYRYNDRIEGNMDIWRKFLIKNS